MGYATEVLDRVYARTGGQCHLCHRRLARRNYGLLGARGAWEVDHSVPRAAGGTDHGGNLFAACVSCNRSKGATSSRKVRALAGKTGVPLSRKARERAMKESTVAGAGFGAVAGALIAGGPGAFALGLLGAALGAGRKPGR